MKFRKCPHKLIFALLTFFVFVLLGGVASAQGYRTIYRFQGGSDGWEPLGVPAVDKDGNIYGTTLNGGANNWGTVFKLTAPRNRGGKWAKTILYNFTAQNQANPCWITLGGKGVLYGIGCGQESRGFIWELVPPLSDDGTWKFAILFAFTKDSDGVNPSGKLALDPEGNLYGATELAGDLGCAQEGCGTVFELKRPMTKNGKWHFQVLHTFTGTPDGAEPFAGVTFDKKGKPLWHNQGGGANDWGAVYRLSPPEKEMGTDGRKL